MWSTFTNFMASLRTLGGIAVGVWFSGVGLYVAIIERQQYKFRHAEFVKEPIRVLKEYPHVEYLLGSNIKQLRFDFADKFTRKNDDYAQVVIPVVGTKTKGKMYTWSSRIVKDGESDKTEEHWRVDRVDLMLHGKEPFTFYRHPDADYVDIYKLEEQDLERTF
ncbi:uncharacterized protein LOC123538326 [Mercenaria mercenaria]|uniref:uncharacterized protein LOC123538326 n=1 Tax=Mercenaria mercenaria TaxID=6596 RepID=UPI00234E5E83|nr:uncharacterized protein LOC123538326 [Mercenaria mercenaria]